MRNIQGQRYALRYHPFPSEREKKERIIGEALLRSKMVSEEELATLRNVKPDPPDLAVTIKEFGELRIEVTESVTYDKKDAVRRTRLIEKLKLYLNELGTKPSKPSNIFIHTEGFAFPHIKPKEIKSIAEQIDSFFHREDFTQKHLITQEVIKSPINVTFVPAQENSALPAAYSDSNLFVCDTTGVPIDKKETQNAIEHIIQKKKDKSVTSHILIIFHGIVGVLGSDNIFDQMKGYLLSNLTYEGIYLVQIIPMDIDYWVSVITIREHPVFQRDKQK